MSRAAFNVQERIRRSVERLLRSKMSAELKHTSKLLAASPTYTIGIVHAHQVRVYQMLLPFYEQAFLRSAKEFDSAVRKASPSFNGRNESAGAAYKRMANEWAAKRSQEISEHTQKRVSKVISDGVADGLSYEDIGRQVKERMGGSVSASRALTIARTESHSALQSGSLETAKLSGVIGKKQWLATRDGRERDSHSEANGQIVDIDAPFIVGDTELDFPGDPSGPPEEIINCRCVVQYILEDEE